MGLGWKRIRGFQAMYSRVPGLCSEEVGQGVSSHEPVTDAQQILPNTGDSIIVLSSLASLCRKPAFGTLNPKPKIRKGPKPETANRLRSTSRATRWVNSPRLVALRTTPRRPLRGAHVHVLAFRYVYALRNWHL